jgi:hypothetical protein
MLEGILTYFKGVQQRFRLTHNRHAAQTWDNYISGREILETRDRERRFVEYLREITRDQSGDISLTAVETALLRIYDNIQPHELLSCVEKVVRTDLRGVRFMPYHDGYEYRLFIEWE